ncbi:hypothetical protein ABW636_11700 [Aquimarina sp. 2201CG1-2-11]|uniref:hypothetical protein n=1 Tax=Aquimarina discodermiae TaxID=3231043 RepID=UPI0034628FA4
MKVTSYKHIIVMLTTLLSLHIMYAQERVSKNIENTYPLTNAGELHIENKYGNIIINGWDQKTIQINIDIHVTKKKKEDADELLQRIKPKFTVTDDFISIISIIEEKSNSMLTKFFNKANPFDFDKSNIQIDYTIHIPFNAGINITNKFGDIIISGWKGKVKANIQHGDMWINKDISSANVEMRFGKLKTKGITYGHIRIKNGEVDIEKSNDLKINSSGTVTQIEKAQSLEIHSSKDQITIGEVGSMQGELMFSKLNLDTLQENINLNLEVADMWVSNINNKAPSIIIDQESSELNINVHGLTIDFTASLEQGLLRIPKSFTNIKTNIIDKRKRIRNISATYGQHSTSGKFQIIGKKGIIVLKE